MSTIFPTKSARRFRLRHLYRFRMATTGTRLPSGRQWVYDSIIACDEVLAESTYTLYLIDLNTATGKMLSFHHYNDKDEFGTFFDDRSSPTKITKCSTADDLATSFPALRTHIAELEVAQESPEEMALYKYVMDRLDAEPDRDEMEIFEEIAPEYGMTTDELKQFMFDMMEKVY